ncbi:hypothetical protein PENARI_c018G09782 [Penicillium arizonense]|uniref:Uncharacterized protein n=1 Tax=Penicillium arizonense TaxID=1835702 RepID=A0A1F5LAK6_PENAI|nr:hypothetical protein PENARI_c018G09782 [Penicillium arizonense]OGE50225.1 hypothetical protein PENARI_c018G09782 [Penicillium arizonense]
MPTKLTEATGAELTYLTHHSAFQECLHRELKAIRERKNGLDMHKKMPQCLTVTEKPVGYFAISKSIFEKKLESLVDVLIALSRDLRTDQDGNGGMHNHYKALKRTKELI